MSVGDFFGTRLANWAVRFSELQSRWRWLGRVVMIGALGYGVTIVIIGTNQISGLDVQWLVRAFAISVVLYLGSVIVQIIAWRMIMAPHRSVGRIDALIYSKGMVLRHLPGGVWHWLGRAAMYKSENNLRTSYAMTTNFIEWITLILVGIGIYGLTNSGFWHIFGILSFLIASSIAWFYLIASNQKRRLFDILIQLVKSITWIALYVIAWILGGIILFVLSQFASLSQFDPLQSISIWSLAGSISLLTIIVPAGLGIREVSLSLLLRPYMPVNTALLVAVLIRVVFTASDLIWGGGMWVLLSNLGKLKIAFSKLPHSKLSG